MRLRRWLRQIGSSGSLYLRCKRSELSTTEIELIAIADEAIIGHDILDKSALEAVKKWRFIPAKRGAEAEASWVHVPIKFEMGNQ